MLSKAPLNYSILRHESLVDMVDHVNRVIQEGWYPLGGVVLVQGLSPDGRAQQVYVQAIRKTIISFSSSPAAAVDVVK